MWFRARLESSVSLGPVLHSAIMHVNVIMEEEPQQFVQLFVSWRSTVWSTQLSSALIPIFLAADSMDANEAANNLHSLELNQQPLR